MIDKKMFINNINFLKNKNEVVDKLCDLIPSDFFTKIVDSLIAFFVDANIIITDKNGEEIIVLDTAEKLCDYLLTL